MSYKDFNEEYEKLPDNLKQEMDAFVEALKKKSKEEQSMKPVPGLAKGKLNIIMTDDFDEPLEDFKEYT